VALGANSVASEALFGDSRIARNSVAHVARIVIEVRLVSLRARLFCEDTLK
jgi:hypothetical protein